MRTEGESGVGKVAVTLTYVLLVLFVFVVIFFKQVLVFGP